MALITCKECSTEVSSEAKTCPKCGVRVKPASKAWMWVLGVPLVLFIFFAISGSNDPVIQAMQKDRQVLDLCLKDLNDPLKSPGMKAALRPMCEGLRDSFIKKFGREP